MTAIGDFMRAFLVKKNVWDVVSGLKVMPTESPNSKAGRGYRGDAELRMTIHLQKSTKPVAWPVALLYVVVSYFWRNLKVRRRAEAHRLALQFQEIGGTIEDKDIILVLTGGLPPTYDVALDSVSPGDLTLDDVVTRREPSLGESARAARYKRQNRFIADYLLEERANCNEEEVMSVAAKDDVVGFRGGAFVSVFFSCALRRTQNSYLLHACASGSYHYIRLF
jgi:hypothetical protein